ncbi:MAG: hypothetical protein JWR07_4594 [Nevskia sp.]|nr:hypothetical protein [Nevskia sp.]
MRSLEQIEQAAASGDLAATAELGSRLLGGERGRLHQQRGAELITAAAEKGSGEAEALCAMMTGAGVFRLQNWEHALDHLQRSAELGWKQAQAQLALLSADRDLATQASAAIPADATIWGQLRRTVDVAAWIKAPPKQSLSDAPRIRKVEHFLPAGVCNWLIMRGRSKLQRARVYAADGGALIDASRTNSETDFNIVETDLVMLLLRARIASVTGLPPAVMELTKVLHYQVGQQFAPHYDFIDPVAPGFAEELAVRGQRIATLLVYLNDDYQGGETDFPKLGLRYKGRKGDALLFANVDTNQQPDPRTLHAGLPPTQGEKWLLSQWLRDRSPAE